MADSKDRPRQRKTLSKAGLDAVVKAYQRDLKRIRNSDGNVGIYQHVNATLVVAGPKDDIAKFERLSESRRLRRVGLQPDGLRLPAPSYWRTRSPFALRSLLTYLVSPQRKRARRKALLRREYRFWGGDNPDEATAAILSECAAHWDVFLANPPELTNQE